MPAMQPPAVPAAPPAGPAGGGLDLSSLLQEVKPFLQGNSQDTTTSTTTTTTTDATAAQYNKDVAAAFAKIQAMTPEQRAAFVPGTAAEKDAWAQYQTNVGPGHFNR
jgi:hypothetical protein